jgi:hypothetical protein
MKASEASTTNQQTREQFASEAATIVDLQTRLTWLAPSRDEGSVSPTMLPVAPSVVLPNEDGEAAGAESSANVHGGRKRGSILHKLFEEVLIGETADDQQSLSERAAILIRELGEEPLSDASVGLSPSEISGCVSRTLSMPEIAAIRPTLVPELPVYRSEIVAGTETASAGIADAVGYSGDGRPNIVVDWKSDVALDPALVEHYRGQVRGYLASMGAERGMIVFVSRGVIESVVA